MPGCVLGEVPKSDRLGNGEEGREDPRCSEFEATGSVIVGLSVDDRGNKEWSLRVLDGVLPVELWIILDFEGSSGRVVP